MKKTLMALAVGAAFAAPSAFADVTISGAINMDLEVLKSGDGSGAAANTIRAGTVGNSVTNTGVATNYSNVTISSTDDIGNGMKVDFAYQITAPTNNNQRPQTVTATSVSSATAGAVCGTARMKIFTNVICTRSTRSTARQAWAVTCPSWATPVPAPCSTLPRGRPGGYRSRGGLLPS